MRAFLRTLVALAYLIAATTAQAGFVLDSYAFKAAGGAQSVTFLGSLQWSSGATISGAIDIGAADAGKEIFLVSSNRGAAARTLTAATTTVDGAAVTKCTTEFSAFALNTVACAYVATPTQNGSVTITATYSGTLTVGLLDVYSVLNRTNTGSNETDSGTTSAASGATSATINNTTINTGGIWFGAHLHTNANATTSPGTEGGDVAQSTFRASTAYRDFQGSSSTPSDAWSWTGAAGHTAASWAFD